MNTLKKCILLGILILNLIPYMQDGKVKWTTTEVGAQDYFNEINFWIPPTEGDMTKSYCPTFANLPSSFCYAKNGFQPYYPVNNEYFSSCWCVFNCLSTLYPSIKPYEFAHLYHQEYGEADSMGTIETYTIPYVSKFVSLSPGIITKCQLMDKMSTGGKGLFIKQTGHVYMLLEFLQTQSGVIDDVIVWKYDTSGSPWFRNLNLDEISLGANYIMN